MGDNLKSKAYERVVEEEEEKLKEKILQEIELHTIPPRSVPNGYFEFDDIEVKINRRDEEGNKKYHIKITTCYQDPNSDTDPSNCSCELYIQYELENGEIKDCVELKHLGTEDRESGETESNEKIHTDFKEYGDITEIDCDDMKEFISKNIVSSNWLELHKIYYKIYEKP